MAILSDTALRAMIAAGDLVKIGDGENTKTADVRRAKECSYAFRPGKAFLAGHHGPGTDFAVDGSATIEIHPGKMVWIRTLESVSIPNNLAGFWWQTNSLAKKGLMLVNMSMVEPEYQGHLACLFVNFGNNIVALTAHDTIAKMIFMEIKGEVTSPYDQSRPLHAYDANLQNLSVNQPTSFLKIGDLETSIEKQKAAAIEVLDAIRESTKTALVNEANLLKSALQSEFETQKKSSLEEFKSEAPKTIWRSLGVAAGLLIVMGALIALGGWTRDNFFEDTEEIAARAAEKAVNDRILLGSQTTSEREEQLESEVADLTRRIQELEESGS